MSLGSQKLTVLTLNHTIILSLDIWLPQDQWQEPLKMVQLNRPVDITKLCYVIRVGAVLIFLSKKLGRLD